MWKFLRYTIYLSVIVFVFMAAYNIRMFIYVPYIESFVCKKTGVKVDIDNFYILPLSARIVFLNVAADDKIKADRIALQLSFAKIIRNIKKPLNYISYIEIHNLSADANAFQEQRPAVSGQERSFAGISMPSSEIKISADEIKIRAGKEIIGVSNADICAKPREILLSCTLFPSKNPFYVNGVMKLGEKENILNTDFTIASEGGIESIISASGIFNISDFSAKQDISIERIKFKKFEISDSTGSFVKNENGIEAFLRGDFGMISYVRKPSGELEAEAEISLSRINSDISADAKSKFVYKNGEGNLSLSLKKLSVYGFSLGDFDISGARRPGGNYNIFCDYGKNGKISAAYKSDGTYDYKMTFDGREAGRACGNIKTGEIEVGISDLPVANLPFIYELSQNAAGSLTIKGFLNETSGLIDFSLKNLETSKIGKTDLFGTITRSSDIYVFYFYKSDKSMIFNSVVKAGRILSTDFKFLNADLSNILKALGYSDGMILGNASGRIKYEKDGTTDFDIKAYDGSFYDNKYKKFEAKGDINLSRINISNFHLRGADEQVNAFATGLIGFTNINPVSSLNLRMRKINIGGVLVDSDITLSGELNSRNEVLGTIASNSIKVSGISFNNFSADTVISTDKFAVSNIKSDNGLDGNLLCAYGHDKDQWRLSGGVNLKNANITGFYPRLEAAVNAAAKIAGTVKKPVVELSLSVKKGKYSGIPFVFNSETVFENDSLRIKNAELLSSKTKFSLKGRYSNGQDGRLSVNFENLNEELINKFVGFRTPLKGEFSGKGTLLQYKQAKPRLKMDVQSPKVYIKSLKLDNIKSKIEIHGQKISVSDASARLADSEIRADKGSFNIKNGKYDLSLFLVNAHLGPADIFGRINIYGQMNKKKGGSTYKGNIDFNNFWINKYRLSSLGLDYGISNKKFAFSRDSGVLKVSGTVDFSDYVKLQDINISKSAAAVNINGFFGSKDFKFAAKAKNIGLDFLGEIMDSPVEAEGKADFAIDASGPFSAPEIKFSAKSAKGHLMDIPYDNIELEIDCADNKAEIKKAGLFRKNEINLSVKGSFPLWIDDSVSKKMKDMPVDIIYEADDSKMHILKYLSEGEIKPKSGKIQVKGEIKGTTGNIRNSGRFTVSNGVFDSKTYLDRVKDFNADIVWDDNSVKIGKFSGKSGSGKFSAYGGLSLEGFNIAGIDITVQTDSKGIPVKVPQLPMNDSVFSRGILQDYSSGEPRFNIKIEGTPAKPKLSGWISLENTKFSFPPPDNSFSDAQDILPDAAEFDLELRAAKNTKFENSLADAWINGSLFIKGTFADPKVHGIIETQRGTVKYLGIVFDIINAKIEIADENVFVSGEAETKVYSPGRSEPEVIMMTVSRSDIDNLKVRFYSRDDPSMDSQTALAKITRTEQTVDNGDNQELILGIISDFDLRQQALRLIDSSFATPFARNVLRKTGIADNFKVSYINSEQSASSLEDPTFADLLYGTKYSVEKNITNQFLLGYSVTFDQIRKKLDLRHEVELRYRLHNNLFLSGSYELESDGSLHEPDRRLMLQHQIRFGLPSNKKTKGDRSGND